MRELVVENQEVLLIPQNFKFANKGKVKEVRAGDFTLELNYPPEGILENTYCEFYTQTSHGKLYFDSYAKEIIGNTLIIASPAKHKFLQRRQYTRIKYMHELNIKDTEKSYKIKTLDISAGGMKFKTDDNMNILSKFEVDLPMYENVSLHTKFEPIRIEKNENGGFIVSGSFIHASNKDRMILTQYCAKRSVEINNK